MSRTIGITLAASNIADNGLRIIEEDPNMRSSIRGYVYDSDEVSAYPTTVTVVNISKETTHREVIDIPSIEKYDFMMKNINLLSGPVNAMEYATFMFNLPKPEELLHLYVAQKEGNRV